MYHHIPIKKGLSSSLPQVQKTVLGMPDSQLAKALQKSANPIFIIDRASVIIWCNEAYSQMVGIGIEDLLRRKPSSLTPSRENTRFLDQIWALLMDGNIWKGELIEHRLDGEMIHVDVVISPLDDANGRPARFMVFENDITDRKAEQERISYMANHDALTGLANRGFFQSICEHTINKAQRNSQKFALLFIDLDGFKAANDTFGHDVGDLVLIETARILQNNVRKSDLVARLGGDEFVCVLEDVRSLSDAGEIASKIISALHLMPPLEGHNVRIGASIGVAMYPNDGMDMDSLRSNADKAMYAAKKAGKNCWRNAGDL